MKIHGHPGGRARASGILRAALPLCAVLLLAGYSIGALLPLPGVGLGGKSAIVATASLLTFVFAALTVRRIDSFFKGASGEVDVAYALARLPDDYEVFHGVDLTMSPGGLKTHDFDHVVLAPFGVFVIETKNWTGTLTFKNEQIQINGISPARPPVAQATGEAEALSKWLFEKLHDVIPVRPILCFTGDTLPADAPVELGGIRLCRDETIVNSIVSRAGEFPVYPLALRERISSLLREHV